MVKKKHPRGQRGLVEADLVAAALAEIERGGLETFSLRSLARAINCDAATLIYRFGSKEGLERAVTERLHSAITPPVRMRKWQDRIINMSRQYRDLAKQYPSAFPLLLRFWTSGPRDLIIAEHWNRALADAGVPDRDIPAVSCATYAAVLGQCMGEIGGLIGLPTESGVAEIAQHEELVLTKRLLPIFPKVDAKQVFDSALMLQIAGLEAAYSAQAQARKA